MDAARIELKLTLDEAGMPSPKLDSFSERLNVQKRIYLVQAFGYDLGYRFSWYLRGPYSRQLTEDAFGLRDELAAGDTDADCFTLATAAMEKIGLATNLWKLPASAAVNADSWLELLASLHYLKEVAYWPQGTDKSFENVFRKLIESKPRFGNVKESALQAWKRLGDFSLIKGSCTI